MRILLAVIALAVWSGAAFAQASAIIDPETLPAGRALDQKYRNTLKRLPEPQVKHDPWGYVRAGSEQNASTRKKETSAK